MSACVFYSITNNDFLLEQVIRSAQSLRNYNQTMDVHFFIYGRLKASRKKELKDLNITVHHKPAIGRDLYPYLVKWLPLSELKYDRVLFLDGDTFFYDDVTKIFQRYRRKDIYARRAPQCSIGQNFCGKKKDEQAIIPKVWRQYHKMQSTKPAPVYNVGVVLFNNKAHQRFKFNELQKSLKFLMSSKLPYPSTNLHNRGEYAFSLMLSRLHFQFSWGDMQKEVAPYFVEWRYGSLRPKGVLVHIFYNHYHKFFGEKWHLRNINRSRMKLGLIKNKKILQKDIGLQVIYYWVDWMKKRADGL